MNLPKTEYFPDDPESLPPARRRRARRLLAPLDADERADFADRLALRLSPAFDFFLFSLLAGVVIAIGLALDAPAFLLLGALLAPQMAPAVGLSLGTVLGSVRLFIRSAIGMTIGSLLVFAASTGVGYATRLWAPVDPFEIQQAYLYSHVSWTNFFVLVMGALLTSALMANPDRHPALPSAALAYELYIPLAIAGFGLGSGVPRLWPDGLRVYAIYLAWGALFGAIVLAIVGFRPLTFFGYTLGAAVLLVGVLLLVGVGSTAVEVQVTRPTSTATLTRTPTPIPPTLTRTPTPVPPTLTSTPTTTATRTLTATPTLSPTPLPVYARVDAQSGGGAFLRSAAGFDAPALTALGNGTLVEILSDGVELEGYSWAHVIVVESGQEGWMLLSLLSVATPAPNW